MRVLVLGSGGREHALAWKIAQSKLVTEVLVSPGNSGTSAFARNCPGAAEDPPAVVALARREQVDFVVIGPDAAIAAGVSDALAHAGILTFGASQAAGRLESSKVFAKHFMKRHGIPTAGFEVFDDPDAADAYVRAAGRPLVVKADGLALGKGVVVARDAAEACEAIDQAMRKRVFGASGAQVVIEETLVGEEASFHVVCDGERFVPLVAAQDHKRLRDGDQGPNTGGMGAYSPPPVLTADVERQVLASIVEPTLAGMRAEGTPFRGVLFVGLMIVAGKPLVIEYNTRFGDPETQVMLTRMGSDVMPLLLGAARGDLSSVPALVWSAPHSMTVVLASGGYPGSSPKGLPITGLDEAARVPSVVVFHAGAARDADGRVVTAGGRVLNVTATGTSLQEAAERAYRAADLIAFEGKQLRRDIGARGLVHRG